MVGKKTVKVAVSGTATQSSDDNLEKTNSYVYITEHDMQGINANNQAILNAIATMQNSLQSINDRLDNIDKKEKEHWFWKNLKSPNFFAVWFTAIISFLLYFIGKPILQCIIKLLNTILQKIG
jgi:hypothetical protein